MKLKVHFQGGGLFSIQLLGFHRQLFDIFVQFGNVTSCSLVAFTELITQRLKPFMAEKFRK